MVIAVPLAGELKFYPFSGADLRISMGTSVFFLILLWSQKIHPKLAGFLTGVAVVSFRVFLDWFHTAPFQFQISFHSHFPAFFYYLIFALFFSIFKIKNFYERPLFIGLLGIVLEVLSNLTESSIRHYATHMQINAHTVFIIGEVAIIRSFFVLGFFNILIIREKKLAQEEQRKRTEQILLLISNLYAEMFQLKKSTKNAEELTSSCYKLYRELKELNHHEYSQSALKIAGELHEIKKDNQRIYAGLSKLMAKEKIDDFMCIEGIIEVITRSNQNYGEMLGKTIKYKVNISGEHPHYQTFILLSLMNNLVTNAVEAISNEGQIDLTINRVDDIVKITIHDNGSGISPKNKPFIFEPGFTTKFDQIGIASNGIGLSYIKNVIENNDGEIKLIDTTETEGTTFEIQLPVASLIEKDDEREFFYC
ncbi:MAG TPA: sensor histidine kinase [Bacillales bacterium]|nr:sensor histidine kinase [Bacillales bacterium]